MLIGVSKVMDSSPWNRYQEQRGWEGEKAEEHPSLVEHVMVQRMLPPRMSKTHVGISALVPKSLGDKIKLNGRSLAVSLESGNLLHGENNGGGWESRAEFQEFPCRQERC